MENSSETSILRERSLTSNKLRISAHASFLRKETDRTSTPKTAENDKNKKSMAECEGANQSVVEDRVEAWCINQPFDIEFNEENEFLPAINSTLIPNDLENIDVPRQTLELSSYVAEISTKGPYDNDDVGNNFCAQIRTENINPLVINLERNYLSDDSNALKSINYYSIFTNKRSCSDGSSESIDHMMTEHILFMQTHVEFNKLEIIESMFPDLPEPTISANLTLNTSHNEYALNKSSGTTSSGLRFGRIVKYDNLNLKTLKTEFFEKEVNKIRNDKKTYSLYKEEGKQGDERSRLLRYLMRNWKEISDEKINQMYGFTKSYLFKPEGATETEVTLELWSRYPTADTLIENAKKLSRKMDLEVNKLRLENRAKSIVWYPWQQQIINLINRYQSDDRKIFCIIDTKGNNGKSLLAKTLQLLRPEEVAYALNAKKDDVAFILSKYFALKVAFIDLARSEHECPYSLIEDLKNGILQVNKYESKSIVYPGPIMVIILSNNELKYQNFSSDRVIVIEISNINGSVELHQRKKFAVPIDGKHENIRKNGVLCDDIRATGTESCGQICNLIENIGGYAVANRNGYEEYHPETIESVIDEVTANYRENIAKPLITDLLEFVLNGTTNKNASRLQNETHVPHDQIYTEDSIISSGSSFNTTLNITNTTFKKHVCIFSKKDIDWIVLHGKNLFGNDTLTSKYLDAIVEKDIQFKEFVKGKEELLKSKYGNRARSYVLQNMKKLLIRNLGDEKFGIFTVEDNAILYNMMREIFPNQVANGDKLHLWNLQKSLLPDVGLQQFLERKKQENKNNRQLNEKSFTSMLLKKFNRWIQQTQCYD